VLEDRELVVVVVDGDAEPLGVLELVEGGEFEELELCEVPGCGGTTK
jgi:hypothetical protein